MTTRAACALMQKEGLYRVIPYGQCMTYAGACTLYESLRKGCGSYGTFSLVSNVEVIRSRENWRRDSRMRSVHKIGFIPK